MTWWLKSRGVLALGGWTLLTTLAGLVFGGIELPLPALTGASGRFLLAGLLPVVPAVLWLSGTGRAGPRTEATAVRPVRRWDTALATALAAAVLAVTLLGHAVGAGGTALAVGRNTLVFLALALTLEPLLGHRPAALAIGAFPLLCAAAGRRPRGLGTEPWALLLPPGESPRAFAASLALLAAAALFALVRPVRGR
ncbi:hypothetical protein BX286_7019 [Streptomyces sp. 3211.6]|uniref:hypothetical protein n=1 Tax=Streptomyces sp. 3211.6 TaxID=1938845 RepID=UPI000C2C835E|nr:hypothetical protein [Streptomyces sp. 3211.6]RKS97205.1 hypothetical protein BX286_7019 [Streptomyces sp. 3211.6]